LIPKDMIRRVVAGYSEDFDMQYLFPEESWMENLDSAAEDEYKSLPRKILRERSYGAMPIRLKPDYHGDFLKQREDKPWIDTQMKLSGNPYNIYDYSMPSEMLKHQEQPMCDDRSHFFIERNRPGPGVGEKTIHEWNNRGWEPDEAPWWSEDVILRHYEAPNLPTKKAGPNPERIVSSFLNSEDEGPQASNVVASWLMDAFPIDATLDYNNKKVASMLSDLDKAERWSKTKGRYIPLESQGVRVRLLRAEPRSGRWTFRTTSGGPTYTTVFQFIPKANTKDPSKLHVRVSCSCPSWVFWGAQWNAWMGEYLYGKAYLKLLPPKVRDPRSRFLVCKHVKACIPIVSRYKLQPITPEKKEKIKKKPKLVLDKKRKEKIRIPEELKKFEKQREVKDAINKWDEWTPAVRREFIEGLDSPGAVAYFGHKFPETAAVYVAERLKDMSKNLPQPSHRKLAEKYSKFFV